MCKQYLKLVKAVQLRSDDGLIGHTSLVFARYNLLTLFQRESVDPRFFRDLFRFCNDELINIVFMDALKRIMQLPTAALRKAISLSEKMIQAILDAIMGEAISFLGLKNRSEPLLTTR